MEVCFSCAVKGECIDLYVKKPNDNRSPYFPIFERFNPPSNTNAISPDGTVKVCKLCQIYLYSQWESYEGSSVPESRRMYFTKRHDSWTAGIYNSNNSNNNNNTSNNNNNSSISSGSNNEIYQSLSGSILGNDNDLNTKLSNELTGGLISQNQLSPLTNNNSSNNNNTNNSNLINFNKTDEIMNSNMRSINNTINSNSNNTLSTSLSNDVNKGNKKLTEYHICCFVCGQPCLKYNSKTACSSQVLENKEYFPFLEKLDPPPLSIALVNGATKICIQCESDLQRQWDDYEKSKTDQSNRSYHIKNDHNTPFSINNPGRFITNSMSNCQMFLYLKSKNQSIKCALCLNKIIDSFIVTWNPNKTSTGLFIPNLKSYTFPKDVIMVDKTLQEAMVCDVCNYFLSCQYQSYEAKMTPLVNREYRIPKAGILPSIIAQHQQHSFMNQSTSNSNLAGHGNSLINKTPTFGSGSSSSAFQATNKARSLQSYSQPSNFDTIGKHSAGNSESVPKNESGMALFNCHVCLSELRDFNGMKTLRADRPVNKPDTPYFPVLKKIRENALKSYEYPVCVYCYYNLIGQWRMYTSSINAPSQIDEYTYTFREYVCSLCRKSWPQKSDVIITTHGHNKNLLCNTCLNDFSFNKMEDEVNNPEDNKDHHPNISPTSLLHPNTADSQVVSKQSHHNTLLTQSSTTPSIITKPTSNIVTVPPISLSDIVMSSSSSGLGQLPSSSSSVSSLGLTGLDIQGYLKQQKNSPNPNLMGTSSNSNNISQRKSPFPTTSQEIFKFVHQQQFTNSSSNTAQNSNSNNCNSMNNKNILQQQSKNSQQSSGNIKRPVVATVAPNQRQNTPHVSNELSFLMQHNMQQQHQNNSNYEMRAKSQIPSAAQNQISDKAAAANFLAALSQQYSPSPQALMSSMGASGVTSNWLQALASSLGVTTTQLSTNLGLPPQPSNNTSSNGPSTGPNNSSFKNPLPPVLPGQSPQQSMNMGFGTPNPFDAKPRHLSTPTPSSSSSTSLPVHNASSSTSSSSYNPFVTWMHNSQPSPSVPQKPSVNPVPPPAPPSQPPLPSPSASSSMNAYDILASFMSMNGGGGSAGATPSNIPPQYVAQFYNQLREKQQEQDMMLNMYYYRPLLQQAAQSSSVDESAWIQYLMQYSMMIEMMNHPMSMTGLPSMPPNHPAGASQQSFMQQQQQQMLMQAVMMQQQQQQHAMNANPTIQQPTPITPVQLHPPVLTPNMPSPNSNAVNKSSNHPCSNVPPFYSGPFGNLGHHGENPTNPHQSRSSSSQPSHPMRPPQSSSSSNQNSMTQSPFSSANQQQMAAMLSAIASGQANMDFSKLPINYQDLMKYLELVKSYNQPSNKQQHPPNPNTSNHSNNVHPHLYPGNANKHSPNNSNNNNSNNNNNHTSINTQPHHSFEYSSPSTNNNQPKVVQATTCHLQTAYPLEKQSTNSNNNHNNSEKSKLTSQSRVKESLKRPSSKPQPEQSETKLLSRIILTPKRNAPIDLVDGVLDLSYTSLPDEKCHVKDDVVVEKVDISDDDSELNITNSCSISSADISLEDLGLYKTELKRLKTLGACNLIPLLSKSITYHKISRQPSDNGSKQSTVQLKKFPSLQRLYRFLHEIEMVVRDSTSHKDSNPKQKKQICTRQKSAFMDALGLRAVSERKKVKYTIKSINQLPDIIHKRSFSSNHNLNTSTHDSSFESISPIKSNHSNSKPIKTQYRELSKYGQYWRTTIRKKLKKRLVSAIDKSQHLRRSLMRPVLSNNSGARGCIVFRTLNGKHEAINARGLLAILTKYI